MVLQSSYFIFADQILNNNRLRSSETSFALTFKLLEYIMLQYSWKQKYRYQTHLKDEEVIMVNNTACIHAFLQNLSFTEAHTQAFIAAAQNFCVSDQFLFLMIKRVPIPRVSPVLSGYSLDRFYLQISLVQTRKLQEVRSQKCFLSSCVPILQHLTPNV